MSAPDTPLSQVPQSRNSLQAVPAVDVLAPAADELGRIAEVLATARANEINKESEIERMRIDNIAIKVMEEARMKAKAAPRSKDVQAVYDENTKQLADLRDQLPEGDEQTLFDAAIARRGIAHMVDLETTRSAMLSKEGEAVRAERVATLSASLVTHEDLEVARAEVDNDIAYSLGAGQMNEAEAAIGRRTNKAVLEEAYLGGLAKSKNFNVALDALNNGQLEAMPVDRQQAWFQEISQRRSDHTLTNLDIRASNGENPAALRQEILGLRESGVLSEPHTRAALSAVDASARAGQAQADNSGLVQQFQSTTVLPRNLTKKTREEVLNTAFGNYMVHNEGASQGDLITGFARRYNMLPESVAGQLAGKILSKNTEEVVEGFELMSAADNATQGLLGNNMPASAEKAFRFYRAAVRKSYGEMPWTGLASPRPVIPLSRAIEELRIEEGQGVSDDRAAVRDEWMKTLRADPLVLVGSVSQYQGGLWGFANKVGKWLPGGADASFVNTFGNLAPEQLPPETMNLLVAATAHHLASDGLGPGQRSSQSIEAAADWVTKKLHQESAFGMSTLNDHSWLPPGMNPGRMEVMSPDVALDAVTDTELNADGQAIDLGIEPYRGTTVAGIVQLAASSLTGEEHADLRAAFDGALVEFTEGTTPRAKALQRGHTGVKLSIFPLMLNPTPMDLMVHAIADSKASRNVSDEDSTFTYKYNRAFGDVNAALGIDRDLRWDPVVAATPSTLQNYRWNQTHGPNEQRPVVWGLWAKDRSTGTLTPIRNQPQAALFGSKQAGINFGDVAGDLNPLTKNRSQNQVNANMSAADRTRLEAVAAGAVDAGFEMPQ